MTVEQALSLSHDEISKAMSDMTQLRQIAKTLIDAANKRIKRLEAADNISDKALQSVRRSGGKFTRSGDANKLRSEIERARRFLNLKTSTVKGARAEYKRLEEAARRAFPSRENADDFINKSKLLYEAFNKFCEMYPYIVRDYGSDQILDIMSDFIVNEPLSVDDLIQPTYDYVINNIPGFDFDEDSYEWEDI